MNPVLDFKIPLIVGGINISVLRVEKETFGLLIDEEGDGRRRSDLQQ